MLAFSRMKSVLAPCFSKATAFSFAVGSHSPPPISLFSKSIRLMNSSSFLHNPSIVSTLSTIALKNHSNSRQVSTLKPEASSSPSSSASGEIHVIVGPMFAGKTTTLLKRIKSESSNGRSIALIKSNKDTRYALDSVVTHDGEKLSCWPLADLSSFKEKVGAEAYKKLEVIGIDEAQFFKDLYDFCSEAADIDGKTLIVAGLDGDYLRRSFGSVLDIIPIADSITKLSARCELCGKRAFFTLRKTEETETELIAGGDVYMPVCRKHYVSGQAVKHYVSGQVVKEATRTVIGDPQRVVQFGAMLL